jgi:hypothetical protein
LAFFGSCQWLHFLAISIPKKIGAVYKIVQTVIKNSINKFKVFVSDIAFVHIGPFLQNFEAKFAETSRERLKNEKCNFNIVQDSVWHLFSNLGFSPRGHFEIFCPLNVNVMVIAKQNNGV